MTLSVLWDLISKVIFCEKCGSNMGPIPSGYEAIDFSCCLSAHSRAGVDDVKLKRPMRLNENHDVRRKIRQKSGLVFFV